MQTPHSVLMLRPANFGFNKDTQSSNSFQNKAVEGDIRKIALMEFDRMVESLKYNGINTLVYQDLEVPEKPDAIFPNNWFSTHLDGTVVLYPMLAPNRRIERRPDIIDDLAKNFEVSRLIDLSEYEQQDIALEGTGSIVFDHIHKTAYLNESERSSPGLLEHLCKELGYHSISFKACDPAGLDIYHTNVLLSIGAEYAIVCLESVESPIERTMLKKSLSRNRTLVEISFAQLKAFTANVLEVKDADGTNCLLMSKTAFNAFTSQQANTIEQHSKIIQFDIPTIEHIGGGGVRCMLAGIHLPRK